MAKISGPNIVTDGLILYYDNKNTRSYTGRVPINLNNEPEMGSHYEGEILNLSEWGGDTGTGSIVYEPCPESSPDGLTFKIEHITSGSGGIYTDFSNNVSDPYEMFSIELDKTYTRSWWLKTDTTGSISQHICSCNRTDNNYIIGNSINVTDTEWHKYSHTFTATSAQTGSNNYRIRHISYDPRTIWLTCIQFEEHPTSSYFVTGQTEVETGIKDLSGHDNHADMTNIKYYDENFQDIVYSGSWLEIDPYIEIDKTGSYTFSQWHYAYDCNFGGWQQFMGGSLNNGGYWMYHGGTNLTFYQDYTSSISYIQNSGLSLGDEIAFDTWTNIAVTYDGSINEHTVYINGGEYTSSFNFTWSPRVNETRFISVGNIKDAGNRWYSGSIENTMIWDRKLSVDEIEQNYKAIKTRYL